MACHFFALFFRFSDAPVHFTSSPCFLLLPAVCATLKTLFTEFDCYKGKSTAEAGTMCALAAEL